MATKVETLLDAARELPPVEQLELIQAISRSLQHHYLDIPSLHGRSDAIPIHVPRSRPVTDLTELVADFWPDDESADDINNFIAQQR